VRVKEDGKILRVMKREKANWIDHVLRRNCRIQHFIEGKIEGKVAGRRERRRKPEQDNLKGQERVLEIERGSTGYAICGEVSLAEGTDLTSEGLDSTSRMRTNGHSSSSFINILGEV